MPTARSSPSCETWNYGQGTPSHRPPCRSMGTHKKHRATLQDAHKAAVLFSKSCRLGLLPPKTHTSRRAASNHLEWPQGRAAMVARARGHHPDVGGRKQEPQHLRASAGVPSLARPRTPRLSPPHREQKKQRKTCQRTFASTRTHALGLSTRTPLLALAPAPVPAPSHHLLPSVPERTRLLLDLPPTCNPDPDPRHRNPVVGSRARVESGLGSRPWRAGQSRGCACSAPLPLVLPARRTAPILEAPGGAGGAVWRYCALVEGLRSTLVVGMRMGVVGLVVAAGGAVVVCTCALARRTGPAAPTLGCATWRAARQYGGYAATTFSFFPTAGADSAEDRRASWNYNEAGVNASFEVGSRELRDDVVGVEKNAGREDRTGN
ncbi:hypothetical protein B0H13DRAFT_2501187 [Mycena leptocephala]|nr:hypothetical protein B0H13DRAFT_2501187 [Mycena leptocephala]